MRVVAPTVSCRSDTSVNACPSGADARPTLDPANTLTLPTSSASNSDVPGLLAIIAFISLSHIPDAGKPAGLQNSFKWLNDCSEGFRRADSSVPRRARHLYDDFFLRRLFSVYIHIRDLAELYARGPVALVSHDPSDLAVVQLRAVSDKEHRAGRLGSQESSKAAVILEHTGDLDFADEVLRDRVGSRTAHRLRLLHLLAKLGSPHIESREAENSRSRGHAALRAADDLWF